MYTLYHHPFCPHSRFIRLALGEHGLDLRLVEERAWERREGFLLLNPAAATPVLMAEGFPPIPGAGIIAEYLDETHGLEAGDRRLLPASMAERVEGRRLMARFNEKFFEGVSNPLVTERIHNGFMSEAETLGFDCIGVTDPEGIGNAGKHFREFLDAGAHGDMDWLAAQPERRMDPRVLWPGVRSIIMLGVNYGPDENPLALLEQRTRGAISAYAQGDDYHDGIKKRLKMLARWLG